MHVRVSLLSAEEDRCVIRGLAGDEGLVAPEAPALVRRIPLSVR